MPTQRSPSSSSTKQRASRAQASTSTLPSVPMELLSSAFLEVAPDAIVVTDAAGHILLVNHQTEALFGSARADLLGQTVELLLPERLHARHQRIAPPMWPTRIRARWGVAWSWWGGVKMVVNSLSR